MSKYYVKAENSKGNDVTASQSLFARAEVITLSKGVKSFDKKRLMGVQTEIVQVTLERKDAKGEDGSLHLYINHFGSEPIVLHLINAHPESTIVNGY